MHLRVSLTVSVALLSAATATSQTRSASRAERPAHLPARFAANEIILRTTPGADVLAVLGGTGATVLDTLPGEDSYLVRTPAGAEVEVVTALNANPLTAWAERNALLSPPEAPGCGAALDPSGQQCTIAIFDGDPAPERYYEQPTVPIINATEAQAMSSGAASIVAVIDTGIDPAHSLFQGRLASPGFDFIRDLPTALDLGNGVDDDSDGLIDEAVGHGTHIAGIIALINPDAYLLPLRVLNSDGNGSAVDVASALHYALDAGADVINLSLGMTGYSQAVDDALERAANMEVAVFAAAGNTGAEVVLYPARRESVIAVAALNPDDTKADFSAFGAEVELSAPGVDIYSAMPGEAWAWWSGTSMACGVASGAASLLHSVDGNPPEAEGPDALGDTCVDIEALNEAFIDLLGEGRIDVEAGAVHILSED